MLIRSATISYAGLVYQLGISFLSGLIVARILGPAQYGIFSLARNMCESITVFTKMGYDIGVVRYFGEDAEKKNARRNSLFIRALLIAVSLVAILPVTAIFLYGDFFLEAYIKQYPDFKFVMAIMALSIPLMSFTHVIGGALRGLLRIKPRIIAEYVLQPTTRLIFFLLLFAAGLTLWSAIIATVLSFAVAVVYLVMVGRDVIFYRVTGTETSQHHHAIYKDLLEVGKYSIVISLTASAATLLQKVDIIMLGYFVPAEQVGQYAVIQMIAVLIIISNSALNQAVAPMLAGLSKYGDKKEIKRIIHQHTRWVAISAIPVFLVVGYYGNILVGIFGKGYSVEVPPVMLLALSQLVSAILSSAGFMLSMTGRHMMEFYTMSAALALNTALNLLLIPKFGIVGAASATLAGVVIANVLRSLCVYKVQGIFPVGKEILLPVIIGLGSFSVISSCAHFFDFGKNIPEILTIAFLFLAGYAAIMFKYGLIPEDRTLIIRLKNRIVPGNMQDR